MLQQSSILKKFNLVGYSLLFRDIMSSSSSDSDDFEPIRKIKINIRPRDEVSRFKAADINEIRASVEAWRPLGPPPHPSLSRRQSSLYVNRGDVVPIAIAIQESIELIVRGHYDPNAKEPKFNSRFLGNIKVAFPNAFAKGTYGKPNAGLKLRINSTENSSIRYYTSRLIKDLDLGNDKVANNFINNNKDNTINSESTVNSSISLSSISSESFAQSDLFELLPINNCSIQQVQQTVQNNSKVIEFDMEILMNDLRKMYEKSPNSRYYNVDVLRYQIAPIKSIQECPLQVCAYWKIEAKLIKLRVDFNSGLNLERLREISFTVNFAEFIPFGLDNNNISTSNSILHLTSNNKSNKQQHQQQQQQAYSDSSPTPPYITYEPQAYWNSETKQLIWKFDTLLAYHKTDGFGSLFAKVDFRNYHEMPLEYLKLCQPSPVDVKFLVIDSTLSKISMSIDSIGYKISLLKREIRSGRYRSEPYIMFS